MNEEQTAAQAIKRFLQTVKGLADLAPGLESLGSVKQAELEARSRLDVINIDIGRAKDQAAEIRAKSEVDVKKMFDDAAAELYKFQVKIRESEEKLNGLNTETATVQARYTEAKAMLDDIVKRVRG